MIAPMGDSNHHCALGGANLRTAQKAVATMTPLMNIQNAAPIAL